MTRITRLDCGKSLLAVAPLAYGPRKSDALENCNSTRASDNTSDILRYSDIGGLPDSVQVMLSRRHLFVGRMFSNGVTILDVADPRKPKPVGFFTGRVFTRTHHLQVSDDLLLLANGENIVAMQSYDDIRGYFENALPMALPIGRNSDRASVFTIFLVPPK
jgi:hypothetical protein